MLPVNLFLLLICILVYFKIKLMWLIGSKVTCSLVRAIAKVINHHYSTSGESEPRRVANVSQQEITLCQTPQVKVQHMSKVFCHVKCYY